jgi:ribonuclease HIII
MPKEQSENALKIKNQKYNGGTKYKNLNKIKKSLVYIVIKHLLK